MITRHINPQLLERLGDTFQIRHLHLAEGPGAYRIPLRTQAGEVLGYLAGSRACLALKRRRPRQAAWD
ncbi:hypothetical protein V2U99_03360 [Klebsiella variicola]